AGDHQQVRLSTHQFSRGDEWAARIADAAIFNDNVLSFAEPILFQLRRKGLVNSWGRGCAGPRGNQVARRQGPGTRCGRHAGGAEGSKAAGKCRRRKASFLKEQPTYQVRKFADGFRIFRWPLPHANEMRPPKWMSKARLK